MLRLLCLVGVILLYSTGAAFANDPVESATPTATKSKPKVSIPSRVSRIRKLVVAWCDELAEDGRNQPVAALAVPLQERDLACPACREFFKLVVTQCTKDSKPKSVRVVKPKPTVVAETGEGGEPATPEPTPTPVRVFSQREPSLEVIQATLDLFFAMAEDEQMVEFYPTVVERLLSHLRNPEGRAPGERDYLDLVAHYAEAPFREHLKEHRSRPAEELPTNTQPTSEQKEQFFDF